MKGLCLLTLGVVVWVSCGSPQTDRKSTPETNTAAQNDHWKNLETGNAKTTLAVDTKPKSPAPEFITRRDLDVVLAAGPAAILAAVVTEPVRQHGRFVGFRITRFRGDSPKTIDLRAGDVILKANGRTIERPENYFAVFEELKIATQLRIDVLRNGEMKTLIYPIHDTSKADVSPRPAPPSPPAKGF